jgi:hypothetical protein
MSLLLNWLATLDPNIGLQIESLAPASSDASFRRYFRIQAHLGTLVVMDAPPPQENCRPFVDIAARLAKALGLPFIPALEKTEPRPEQKAMSNSTFQARNVDGSLGIVPGNMPSGPVLLVDDIVGSRWTLTVAAWLLRRHGSGEVWPLALSMAGSET